MTTFAAMKYRTLQIAAALYLCVTAFLGCNPVIDPDPEPEEKVYDLDYLFDVDELAEITVNVKLKDWDDLLSYYDMNPNNEECVPATFVFKKGNDIFQLDSVGLRLRGNTSRRRPEGSTGKSHSANSTDWHHCHFGIKFGEYIDTTFCTADRIILKWHKDDAMYCREVYCYNLFRNYGVWTSPRASYTKLSIHVEGDSKPAYYGIYALIEGVNDSYLESRVAEGKILSKKANLWKASYGATFNNISDGQMGVESISLDPSKSKSYVYDLKTNKKKGLDAAKAQLLEFSRQLKSLAAGSQELKTYLNSVMDIDLFLKTYAVNVVVGMWDDYWSNSNNFYFMFDSDGKFYFIPYDYDNTLGTSSMMNSGTQDMTKWGALNDSRMLMYKVLSIPEFMEKYKADIKELVSTDKNYFTYNASLERITRWHNMISQYITNDTGEDMYITDVPASWGNCKFYRLRTGNEKGGESGDANFFLTKAAAVTW